MKTEMPDRVARAFAAYVEMTPRRSLRRLTPLVAVIGITAGKATLERWSIRFGWTIRAEEHDRACMRAIESSLNQGVADKNELCIVRLRTIQDRFVANVLADPDDSALTAAQRRGLRNPTFAQFRKAVLLEKMIFGGETNRAPRRGKVSSF